MTHLSLSTLAAAIAGIAGLGLLLDTAEVVRGRHTLASFFDALRDTAAPGMGRWSVASPKIMGLLVSTTFVAGLTVVLLYVGSGYAAVGAMLVASARWAIEGRFAQSATSATRLQIITWITLALFAIAGTDSAVQYAAMGFLAFHGTIGYVMAGVGKLKSPFWVDGSAVRRVLTSDTFGAPRVAAVLPLGLLSAPLTWGTVAFEIGAPLLAFTSPDAALVFFGAGLLFHISIALMMGITQFIFAFGATYPAIYASVVWLHEHLL